MILEDFIKQKKISIKKFAIYMGVSPGLIYKIRSGERPVTPDLAVKIEKATCGEVSRTEALWPNDFTEKNLDNSIQTKWTL